MTEDLQKLRCQEFQAKLPGLIGSGADVSNHPHIRSCELCRKLLDDLESIAEAARQLLPVDVEPPADLWEHIESAIRSEEGDPGGGGGTKLAQSN